MTDRSTRKEEHEEAVERLHEMQARIADALLEYDHIVLQENPRIEADYAVKIGGYRYQLMCAELDARRAKRKYTLAQMRANRNEQIVDEELEAQLDKELASWEMQIKATLGEYAKALAYKHTSKALSPRDAAEVKRLHRLIIMRLHPDLHPERTDAEAKLFLVAQSAYEHGDLETLKSLEAATAYLDESEETIPEDVDAVWVEVELAEVHLHEIERRLEELKSSYPYELKEKLEDKKWVLATVESHKQEIERQKEVAEAYRKRFEELMKENPGS